MAWAAQGYSAWRHEMSGCAGEEREQQLTGDLTSHTCVGSGGGRSCGQESPGLSASCSEQRSPDVPQILCCSKHLPAFCHVAELVR